MHRHIQFAEDGITVRGISFLSEVEEDRPELLYFPETEDNAYITFDWRYIDGEWLPPLPEPEEVVIEREISEITATLKSMYQQEQFNQWLETDEHVRGAEGITLLEPAGMSLSLADNDKETLKQRLIALKLRLIEIKQEKECE